MGKTQLPLRKLRKDNPESNPNIWNPRHSEATKTTGDRDGARDRHFTATSSQRASESLRI